MTSEQKAGVDVLAVLGDAPSVTVAGVTVAHNTAPWRVATNRHRTLYGRDWGWIEGAPGHVCWSDDERFNRQAAGEVVAAHAAWLEEQKPISIRLVEARERYAKAKAAHESAHEKYVKAHADLLAAEGHIAALARVQGGA